MPQLFQKPQIHRRAKPCTTTKYYNAKFQVQDDEEQLNGWKVSIHLVGASIHCCSCGFRTAWCVAVPLIAWWRQCRSPQPCGTGVYLLLRQVSQPGTKHLKEALTLLWIRLTWFMWAGCGFVSPLWHSVFHVRLFMRIWRWVFACLRVFLKAAIRPRAGLDPWRVKIYLSMNLL